MYTQNDVIVEGQKYATKDGKFCAFADGDGYAYWHDTKNMFYVGDGGYDYFFMDDLVRAVDVLNRILAE